MFITSSSPFATPKSNGIISSVGWSRSGTMIVLQPAANAERIPFCESSSAIHSLGSRPSRFAALDLARAYDLVKKAVELNRFEVSPGSVDRSCGRKREGVAVVFYVA